MKKIISSLVITILAFMLFNCKSDNEVLASYSQGEIKRKQVREIAALYELDAKSANKKWQNNVVKHLVMLDLLQKEPNFKEASTDTNSQEKLKLIQAELSVRSYKSLWREKQSQIPEPVYHLEALTLKQDNSASTPELEDANFKLIQNLRSTIVKDNIDFEDVTKKDPKLVNKIMYQDLDYNSIDTLPPQVNTTVLRMSNLLKGNAYRVNMNDSMVYSQADVKSPLIHQLKQYDIVTGDVLKENQDWVKISFLSSFARGSIAIGYIQNKDIVKLDIEDKNISQPIKTIYGWQLIYIKKSVNVDEEDFIELMSKKDKKSEVQNQDPSAYWKRTLSQREAIWEKSILEKYGFSNAGLPKLEKTWLSKDILVETPLVKITKEDFVNYIQININFNDQIWKTLTQDYERISAIFESYAKNRLFQISAKNEKIDQQKYIKKCINGNIVILWLNVFLKQYGLKTYLLI